MHIVCTKPIYMLNSAIKTRHHRCVYWCGWSTKAMKQGTRAIILPFFREERAGGPLSMLAGFDERRFFLLLSLVGHQIIICIHNNSNNKYLGQQQFRIYHFYAFYIKNKFNNCFVFGVQVPASAIHAFDTWYAYAHYVRASISVYYELNCTLVRARSSHPTHFFASISGWLSLCICIAFRLSQAQKPTTTIRCCVLKCPSKPTAWEKNHFEFFIYIFAIRP